MSMSKIELLLVLQKYSRKVENAIKKKSEVRSKNKFFDLTSDFFS